MQKIILDLSRSSSRGEIHDVLAKEFGFPEYYGRNLDALYDMLSERVTETAVGVILPSFVYATDEDGIDRLYPYETDDADAPEFLLYLKRLMRLLSDVEEDNPHLAVFILPRAKTSDGDSYEMEI